MINFIKTYFFELCFSIAFLTLSMVLNLQFLEGSNINNAIAGHDEYIAVKEVYSILYPASLKHFIMAVISGNALYYGRIMFYLDAVFAYFPFKIWGITGMVIAIRMVHSFFLLASLLLLSSTFLKSNQQKAIFFAGTFCLYYTMYFIMMPKPEPHQLFFLALFLNQFKKANWTFGKHFFWIGIAYGLKFNMLLLLPLVFGLPLVKESGSKLITNVISASKAFIYLIAGIITAIPCLALSPIKPLFLTTYLHETFEGTVKSYDNAAITANDWVLSGLGGSFLGHYVWAYPFIILVLIVLLITGKKAMHEKDFSIPILLLSGLILTIVIILKTKRLWPHYLWTGYILMFIGLVAALNSKELLKGRKVLLGALLVFLSSTMFFFFKRELPLFLSISKRPEVIKTINLSHKAIHYLKFKYPGKRIGTDATLLYPFKDFVAVNRYHPFVGQLPQSSDTKFYWYGDKPENIWEDSNDVVVFYRRNPEKIRSQKTKQFNADQEALYQIFQAKTATEFVQDTVFDAVVIFKRK